VSHSFDVVIVGGGHAGAQAAMALRQHGFTGSVAIVGNEPDLPYDRPPLSKDYLAGEKEWDRLVFRSAEAWAEKKVELLLGRHVDSVDAEAHELTCSDGDTIDYDKLIWAAGGPPPSRPRAGRELTGVHYVRNRADVDQMMRELSEVREGAAAGGG